MELAVLLCALFSLQFPQTLAIDCPQEYISYSGHCYGIFTQKLNFTEARHACQSEGGDLVSVNDKGEDDFLRGSIVDTDYTYYWIGMLHNNGKYEWLDGTEATYTNWGSGEPDCGNIFNDCKVAYSYYYDFKWEDFYAFGQHYFICELIPTTVPRTTVQSATDLKAAIHLECHHQGWYVTVDLNKLSSRPSDISEIYMNEDKCVGTLQGNLLVFNETYQECNTHAQVVNKTVLFNNYIMYSAPDSSGFIRDLKWKEDLLCSHGYEETNTVNIKPDIINHGLVSGEIPGSHVDIKLYTDSVFSQPLQGSVKLGTPIYVQVSSLSHPDVAMVVDSCEADVNMTSTKNQKPHLLIQHHCSMESSTQIIAVRNQVTRFRFNMFELPNEHDGIYVRCHVLFCDALDFSSQCEQTCELAQLLLAKRHDTVSVLQ